MTLEILFFLILAVAVFIILQIAQALSATRGFDRDTEHEPPFGFIGSGGVNNMQKSN
jgi:hypothetical protein